MIQATIDGKDNIKKFGGDEISFDIQIEMIDTIKFPK